MSKYYIIVYLFGHGGKVGKLTDEQKLEIVEKYKNRISARQLGCIYGITEGSVRSILKVRKIPPHGIRKYCFNESFFNVIDTEEKAYWLGFIYADGNVHHSTLSIKLAAKDLGHLEKFRCAIQSTHLLEKATDRDAYRIRINSVSLAKSLASVGVTPAKSFSVLFPEFLSKTLRQHFIRGVFDGDGWLTCYKSKNMIQPTWHLGFCSGSKIFLEKIQEEINLYGSLYTTRKGGYQLDYGGNKNAKKVADLLYVGATVWLERKYQKYLNFCEQLKIDWQGQRAVRWQRNRNELGRFAKLPALQI